MFLTTDNMYTDNILCYISMVFSVDSRLSVGALINEIANYVEYLPY